MTGMPAIAELPKKFLPSQALSCAGYRVYSQPPKHGSTPEIRAVKRTVCKTNLNSFWKQTLKNVLLHREVEQR